MSGKDEEERTSGRLAEIERRLLVVETELIAENTELAKRVWLLLCKYEPELANSLRAKE